MRRLGSRWQAVAQVQALSFRFLFEQSGGANFRAVLPGGGGGLGLRYAL